MTKRGWCKDMSWGTCMMFLACFFSVGLVFPAQLQLARISVWTLSTWLGLEITQTVLAWMGVAMAIKRYYSESMHHTTIGDAHAKAAHFGFMTTYAVYATIALVRIATLFHQSSGEFRANVLESNSLAMLTVTHFEADLRDALNFQTSSSAFAIGSISAFLYGTIASVAMLARRQLAGLESISVGNVLKKTSSKTHSKKSQQHKIEDSSSESESE